MMAGQKDQASCKKACCMLWGRKPQPVRVVAAHSQASTLKYTTRRAFKLGASSLFDHLPRRATLASKGATDTMDAAAEAPAESNSSVVSVTADFAMQNVILQMGLRLGTPDGRRITHVSRWVLRCSACFFITKVRFQELPQKNCALGAFATFLAVSQ